MSLSRSLRLVALGALMSACSSDSSVAPARQTNTLDGVLRELALPSLAGASAGLSSVPALSGLSTAVPSCAFSASTQSFLCPANVVDGLTFTQSYALLDAAGRSLSAFDANTTAAVRLKTSVVGTIASGAGSVTVDQVQELTLSGLLTATHVLNGTSTAKLNGTVIGVPGQAGLPIATTTTTTIANLVVPNATAGTKAYPASGTITIDATSTNSGIALVTRLQMTFNGTSKVDVITTIFGETRRCTLDLANPVAACA